MKPPYRLVTEAISHDTIECLEKLLRYARRGDVVGVAYAAIFKRRRYFVDTAGEAHRSPTFTRGVVAALDDHLRQRIEETRS